MRTHQFNSVGEPVSEGEFARLLGSINSQLITVRLSDRFGDDGLVGGAVAETLDGEWEISLLMMSCRAIGRGVIGALLDWLVLAADRAGASQVAVPCVISERNVPLRIALVSAGFRAKAGPGDGGAGGSGHGRIARYVRRLGQDLPQLPDWVSTPAAG